MQLFVGTWPPDPVDRAIAAYPRPQVADLRWATASQWFVKMRPLGHVRGAIVPELIGALGAELDGVPPPTASITTVTNRGWLTARVDGLDELTTTVFEVTEHLVPVTHPQPLHCEIVLARSPTISKDLVEPLEASWLVTSIVLAKGARSAEGPGYLDVESFPIG